MVKTELMDKIEEVGLASEVEESERHSLSPEAMSKDEILRQFYYVKRITKVFLTMTWMVLLGSFAKNGIALIEWMVIGLFLMITIQLWNIGPRK